MLFRLTAILLAYAAIVPSAYAQNSVEIPPQNNQQQTAAVLKAASAFLPVAKKFGCDKFAWGSFVSNGNVQLEYVPSPDNVESWTHMMTITVYGLPGEPSSQIAEMKQMMGQLVHSYGKIFQEDTLQDGQGMPRLFIEYEIGGGVMKEHNSGTFMKTATHLAAFIQVQTRGIPVNSADAANMKLFAQNKLPIN